MNALIRAEALGKRYGKHWALTDCELDIPAGHVIGLVGPNGAGKTTLLNLVTGQPRPARDDSRCSVASRATTRPSSPGSGT